MAESTDTAAAASGRAFVPTHTSATILCPLCGMAFESNASNMCPDCLRGQVNLAAELQASQPIIQCKRCHRWQAKNKHWVAAEMESGELLALVLKYLPGLQAKGGGITVVEAGWIWTEPHSKRLKLKLTVRKEVLHGVTVQERVQVPLVVKWIQCEDCAKEFTEQTWKALVQIRQRVEHKRTFFFLEQLILARRLQSKVLDIDLAKDGMDLYFTDKNTATSFVSFLGTVVPTRTKTSRKLVSEDRRNNIHRNQHTMVVEIVPLCKDDLVLLPAKGGAGVGGGLQGFVLVSRVTSVLHLLDPTTLARAELPAAKYWRNPLEAVMSNKDLVQFEVLDVEPVEAGGKRGAHQPEASEPAPGGGRYVKLAEVEVVKTSDFGVNDVSYRCLTHLGAVLQPGDSVLGYDLKNATSLGLWEEEVNGLKFDPPDVILVKRVEPERGNAKKERRRLQRLRARRAARERDAAAASRAASVVSDGDFGGDLEEDFLAFQQELEEDGELRELLAQHAAEGAAKAAAGELLEEEEGEGDEKEEAAEAEAEAGEG